MEKREYPVASNFDSSVTSSQTLSSSPTNKNKNRKGKHQKRFTDEQIKSLESKFELQTQLEPAWRVAVARELGLQPRQVAIWFQNRRARWKSKQIEHEFIALRASYDSLACRVESLEEEKKCLLLQLQKLSERVEKTIGHRDCKANERSSSTNCENDYEAKPRSSHLKKLELEDRGLIHPHKDRTSNDRIMNIEEEGLDEALRKSEHDDDPCSLGTTPWQWLDFDLGGNLLDQSESGSSSQWLNFWT